MHCSWNNDRVEMLKKIESKINKNILNGFSISDDLNKNGVWWNYKQAQKMAKKDSTHHIVLQDDMIPCDNFIETLLELISYNPNNIIHIFGTDIYSDIFYKENHPWFVSYDGVWGGSWILPKKYFNWYELAEEVIEHNSEVWDDTMFNFYCTYTQTSVWHITPTLLHHEGNNKSLIKNTYNKFRDANCHISNNTPLDWSNLKLLDIIKQGYRCNRHAEITYLNLKRPYKLSFLEKLGLNNVHELKEYDKKNSYEYKITKILDIK